MHLTYSIDWLHVTNPSNDARLLPRNLYQLPSDNACQNTHARYGYTIAAINRVGAKAMANPDRAEMGIHVSYSAGTLSKYAQFGIDPRDILTWHDELGGKVSRIDLAIDVRDSDLSIVYLYEQLVEGVALTRVTNYTMLKGQDGGTTLYIGSRSSNVFIRVYDKAKEQGVIGNWKRIELEIKGNRAMEVGHELATLPLNRFGEQIKRYLIGVITFPDTAWSEMLGEKVIDAAPANKKETDTQTWLMKVAAPSLGKLMARTGNLALLAEFLRIVRLNRYGNRREE